MVLNNSRLKVIKNQENQSCESSKSFKSGSKRMKNIRITLIALLTVCYLGNSHAQQNQKITIDDFMMLFGNWQGTLTYLDYSSGKPYTMPADVDIRRMEKTNKIIFSNIYPNESSANSSDTIAIKSDGKHIDKALLKSKKTLANGDVVIVTHEQGKDGNDNKPATFRLTYTFGKTTFSKKKEVRFKGTKKWITRHEYSYTRKPGR